MEERFDNEDTSGGSSGSLGVPARKSLAVGIRPAIPRASRCGIYGLLPNALTHNPAQR